MPKTYKHILGSWNFKKCHATLTLCLNKYVIMSASVRRQSISQSITTVCLQTEKRVSVKNFCGLILFHNSAYFDFEVFKKSLVGALICFSCNVYFEPIDIKNLFASNGQSVIGCGNINFFRIRAILANFI